MSATTCPTCTHGKGFYCKICWPDPKKRVNHPKFESILERDERHWVVCFKVGRYVEPSPEARAAEQRIRAILNQISSEDLELFRRWHGNVVCYGMNSEIENPETTDAMVAEFIAAAKAAFPNAIITEHWHNASHGVHGYSVCMRNA